MKQIVICLPYCIGHCWFDILLRLNNNNLIDEIKEYLSDKTFIGEYVGNQKPSAFN